jgi:hypothetical protein
MSDNKDIFGRPLGGNPAKMNTFLRFDEPKTSRQLEKESGCPNGKGHMDALVGKGVKSAGYGKGYVIDREWFDRQPEDKRLSFLARSGMSVALSAAENQPQTSEAQYWCVNFDSKDCLKHGLEDHSKNQPYDLCCRRKKDVLYVEVKGTQTTGTGVILTSGEVEFARRHRENMALFVFHSIKVSRSRNLSDGTECLIMPWDVDHGSLKPMSYKYELP